MSLNQAFSSMFATRSSDASGGVSFVGFPGLFDTAASGTKANERTSLMLSAFYNGVNQLSNDIAKLPKAVYKKEQDQINRFSEHPVNYLISQRPNDLMNAFDFWKIIEYSKIVKGNAFAEIIRNKVSGQITSLIFRYPDDVSIYTNNDKLFYKYKSRNIAADDMLHFKGFTFDGIVGVGVITFAAKQLGISLDSQTFQQEVYKDRGLGYGVIESDIAVNPQNKKMLEDGFAAKMSSGSKFRVPMLDEGMKYKSISITPVESQFLETNKNGVIEVCRWLNIAPHKLKELGNANYSNIYQQSIEHVQDSVLPSVVANEQELNNKLFDKKEAGIIYTKFNINSLLRGDLQMKKEYYTAAIYSGYMTRNEVRALEELNPIEGLNEVLQPVNMQALSMANEIIKQQSNGNSTK
jgi:HK97 family phage portal protein